jgi:hypothetical protein
VLGEAQSGEMQEVGFNLYVRMLDAAVRSLKQGKEPDLAAPLGVTTEINLHVPALLPAEYCSDVHERLVLYKRFANCDTQEELDALREELGRDPGVLILGEDVAVGGPFGVTKGLAEEFGQNRVINTPISEGTVVGLAVGAALLGARPVVEVMFTDFITLAMDQLVNHAGKLHYMSGGQLRVPLTVRVQGGALGGDELRAMHARKTGALIRAAAVAGAIMAGAPDPLAEAIDQYAAELGLAFQIVDDVLDVEGHAEELGKTAGKDAAAGKPTYPALYGLEGSRRLAARSVEAARAALAAAGLGGRLPEIAEWVIARTA